MGKSDANECNENSFSNCRVQLALSIKKDGMILEKQHRGRLHPSFLRRVSVPCEGNRKGRKAYCGLVRMWSSPCRRDGEVEKSAPEGVFPLLP